MKYTLNLRKETDIYVVSSLPVSEVLIQIKGLSRYGGVAASNLEDLIDRLKTLKKEVILAWDSVSKDHEIEFFGESLKKIVALNPKIRFLDPGIGNYMIKNFPNLRLQLSLEHGSLNSPAIHSWIKAFSPQIEKVILSNQIPLKNLKTICKNIPVKTEILGFGPIEIFYSRRHLLSKINEKPVSSEVNRAIKSKDRPDQENPIIQTESGTIVFYDKAINLFSLHAELEAAGIDSMRIEYLNRRELDVIASILSEDNWQNKLISFNCWQTTSGFIESNLSDSLFGQLSNPHISNILEDKVGTVIEAVKQRYCLIKLEEEITLPTELEFQSPEGMRANFTINQLLGLNGKIYNEMVKPGVYRYHWQKYMVTGSILVDRN